MPYPFIYFPTLDELSKALQDRYQVKIKGLTGSLNINGQSVTGNYFFRETDDDKYVYPVPNLKPTDRLTPDVLRSILRALHVDPKDFGFVLD